MTQIIGIYLRNEDVRSITKLLKFLDKKEYKVSTKTAKHIKNTYNYLSIHEKEKYIKLHFYDNFKYMGKYYMTDDEDFSIITDMISIDEFFKLKFKELFKKNSKDRVFDL